MTAQTPPQVVDIIPKLAQFTDQWSPKVAARLNDYEIKLVKMQNEWYGTPTTTPTSCSCSSPVS